jgi:hypothetical protein
MATNQPNVDELERKAEHQRERLGRRVVELRNGLEESLDLRRITEECIRARPGAFYGSAAVFAALTGYIFARLLKS